MSADVHLSRRERQIMDIVYWRGEASATDVLEAMGDPPSRATVRTLLRILEEKGHLSHRSLGREYVYRATRPRKRAGRSALKRVIRTFFDGSLEEVVAAHLTDARTPPSPDEIERITEMLRDAARRGKRR